MISMSCRIPGGDFDLGGQATRRLKEHLARVGVSGAVMRRAMIAAYEAEMNVVIHARTGTLWARLDSRKLDLEVADEGPGIPDLQLALREGWSTASAKAREMGFGAGMGLPNIRRNSDLFDIETRPGRGTRIRSTIFLSPASPASPAEPQAAFAAVPSAQEDTVEVSPDRCRRCLRCIFSCPTGALRVHGAGPVLRSGLCVGCAECIRACPSGVYGIRGPGEHGDAAFRAAGEGAVLVLPQAFLSSPHAGRSAEGALHALALLGLHEVRFTEEWSDAILQSAREEASRGGSALPLIPPLCPAVTALVESRFPSLIPNLGTLASPLECAGEEFPLRPVFLLAACPAQLAAAHASSLTGRLTVLTPVRLSAALRSAQDAPSAASAVGAGARIPSLRAPRAGLEPVRGELAVSGARAVLRALASVEAGALSGLTLLDLRLCEQGCSGSPLVSSDPFLAELGWQRLLPLLAAAPESDAGTVRRPRPYAQRAGMRLGTDMGSAIQALGRMDRLARALPGRDCGACGAPACALYAEDVIMGRAESSSCPHASLTREVLP